MDALLEAARVARLGVSVAVDGARRAYVNDEAARIYGRTIAELEAESPFTGLPPDEVARLRAAFASGARRAGPSEAIRTTVVRPDGSSIAVDVSYVFVTHDGQPAVAALMRDLSESTGAQGALARSEARFQKLIETAPDPILVQRDGSFVYANRAHAMMLGYDRFEEVAGARVVDFVHPDDRAIVAARTRAVRATGGPLAPQEYRVLRRDGHVISVEVSSIAIDFAGADAILSVGRETTERKEMLEQLAHADRLAAIGALAAGVAHEVSNPLLFVLLQLDLLEASLRSSIADPAGRANALTILSEVRDGGARIATIMRELRDFSRRSADDAGPADVAAVVESAIDIAGPALRLHANVTRLFARVPPVAASPTRLGQVILNLLVNAAQAFPDDGRPPGEVRVAVGEEAGRVVIDVSDEGPGIPPELLERIFEPFFTTKPPGMGTGLGLAVCRRI